jgi:plastocyanin
MANATKRATTGHTPFADTMQQYGLVSTAQTYYPNAAIGVNTAGFAQKCDDSASLLFVGVSAQPNFEVPSGGAAGDVKIEVKQPRFLTAPIAAAAADDVGRTVYWTDDQTVSFDPGVYGNIAGVVQSVPTATAVCFEPGYTKGAKAAVGAARTLAATGNQDITKYDVGKVILVPNSAALQVNLPAIADVNLGDEITFIKTSAAAFAITVDGAGSETINGSATHATMDALGDTITIRATTSTTWRIVASAIS